MSLPDEPPHPVDRPLATATAGPADNTASAPKATPSQQSKLSFAARKAQDGQDAGSIALLSAIDGDRPLLRNVDRPLRTSSRSRNMTPQKSSSLNPAKQRNTVAFFEDAFAVEGGANSSARQRVHGDSIVMVEVKTNVIISDEFTFITELSYHLSSRYQRPVSSIVVTLHHGTCMFFGGSFDAAYVMSVFALPSQLMPTTNKRNAALIQKYMEEALGVGLGRGFLRFVPINEEHLACNGKTVAGEIEDLERNPSGLGRRQTASPVRAASGGKAGDGDTLGPDSSKRSRKKLSVRSLTTFRPPQSPPEGCLGDLEPTPPSSLDEPLPTVPESPTQASAVRDENMPHRDPSPEKPPKVARRKKSFVATIFGRSSGAKSSEHRMSLLPIHSEK